MMTKKKMSDLPRSASDLHLGHDDDPCGVRLYDAMMRVVKVFCCGRNSMCCKKRRRQAVIHNLHSQNGDKMQNPMSMEASQVDAFGNEIRTEMIDGIPVQVTGRVINAFDDDDISCTRRFLKNFSFARFLGFLIPSLLLSYGVCHLAGVDMVHELKEGVMTCCQGPAHHYERVKAPKLTNENGDWNNADEHTSPAPRGRTNAEALAAVAAISGAAAANDAQANIETSKETGDFVGNLKRNLNGALKEGDLGFVAPGTVREITHPDELQEVLHAHEQVAVKFYATWCGPCKKSVEPLKKMAKKYPHWTFISVDVEGKDSRAIAKEFKIKQMPTFKFVHHTNVLHTITGFNEKKLFSYLEKRDGQQNERLEQKLEDIEVKRFTEQLEGQNKPKGASEVHQTKQEVKQHEQDVAATHRRKAPEVFVQEVHSVKEFVDICKNHPWVVAKFYADWCGPCKKSAKAFLEMAKLSKQRLKDLRATQTAREAKIFKFIKVNVDKVPELTEHFEIQSMPTFKLFSHQHKETKNTDYDDEYDEMVGWDEYGLKEKLGLTRALSKVSKRDLEVVDGRVLEINGLDEFNTVVRKNKNVVAKFYADWCGPCRASIKAFDKMARDSMKHPDPTKRFKFVKVNVDRAQSVSSEQNIQSMPTFKYFTNGQEFPEETTGWDEYNVKKKLSLLPKQYVKNSGTPNGKILTEEELAEENEAERELALKKSDADVVEVTSVAEMEKLLKENKRSIVKFCAEWAGPCRKSEGVFEEFASRSAKLKSLDKEFKFLKVNVDTSAELVKKYSVKSMPTFLFFSNSNTGNVIEYDRFTGWNESKVEAKLGLLEGKVEDKGDNNVRKISTLAEFKSVLQNNKRVVAKFFATWCPPCKASKTPFYEASKELKDWTFVEVDVDKCEKELKRKFGIKSLPTFKWFAGRSESAWDTMVGWDEAKFLKKFSFVEGKYSASPEAKKAAQFEQENENDENVDALGVEENGDDFKTDETKRPVDKRTGKKTGPECAEETVKVPQDKQFVHDSQAKRKCEGGVCRMDYGSRGAGSGDATPSIDALDRVDEEALGGMAPPA